MARYKVEKKFVVTEGWSKEVKVFSSEADAREYAVLLNEVYASGIQYAVDNPTKVMAEKAASDY